MWSEARIINISLRPKRRVKDPIVEGKDRVAGELVKIDRERGNRYDKCQRCRGGSRPILKSSGRLLIPSRLPEFIENVDAANGNDDHEVRELELDADSQQ